MAARAGWVLGCTIASLVIAGCTADTGREQRPEASGKRASSRPTVTEGTSIATGTPAPRKGDTGFAKLPECFGRRATILGSRNGDRIVGTRSEDVIVTLGGDDHVSGLRKRDVVCTGPGNDTVTDVNHWQVQIDLAGGDDRVTDASEVSEVRAGPGDDRLTLAVGSINVDAGPGDDIVRVLSDQRRHAAPHTLCFLPSRDRSRPRQPAPRSGGWTGERPTGQRALRIGRSVRGSDRWDTRRRQHRRRRRQQSGVGSGR